MTRQSLTLEERFVRFHGANPDIYAWLRSEALSLVRAGRQQFGIRTLWEALRWRRLQSTSNDGFKMNNNYTSHYARLLMANEPELDGLFEIRG